MSSLVPFSLLPVGLLASPSFTGGSRAAVQPSVSRAALRLSIEESAEPWAEFAVDKKTIPAAAFTKASEAVLAPIRKAAAEAAKAEEAKKK